MLSEYPLTGSYCAEFSSSDLSLLVLRCHQSQECPHQVTASQSPPDMDSLLQEPAHKYQLAFTVMGVISLVFLLITLYVYSAVPDLYNLHGKIVISNVVSIFLVTLYLIIVFNIPPSHSLFCIVLGYLVILYIL